MTASPATSALHPACLRTLNEFSNRFYAARKTAVDERDIDYDDYKDTLTAEETAVATDLTDILGFTCLGVGRGRIVFAFPDTSEYADAVVKFPRYGEDAKNDGHEQNSYEAAFWRTVHGEYEDIRVVPLIDAGDDGAWVVQPQVTPLEADESVPDEEKEARVQELHTEMVALRDHLHRAEVAAHNTAMWDGELCLFDYGLPPLVDAE